MADSEYTPKNMPEVTIYYETTYHKIFIEDVYVHGLEVSGYLYDGLMDAFRDTWEDEIYKHEDAQAAEYETEVKLAVRELMR